MSKITSVAKKSRAVIADEGLPIFLKRSTKYVYFKKFPDRKKRKAKDILFINGCALPHPSRYRVEHQMEQLKAAGISSDAVYFEQLDMAMLKYYRGFVFFRCPITATIEQFIAEAKTFNKTCFFDIDDLVIDQKYTNKVKYVQQMQADEKKLYDDGVYRMKKTLELCDVVNDYKTFTSRVKKI